MRLQYMLFSSIDLECLDRYDGRRGKYCVLICGLFCHRMYHIDVS